MPRQTAQEWVRLSLRTPGILIFGMVMAPCGWILDLTATVSPNWRTIHNVPGTAANVIIQQGIFDICQAFNDNGEILCNQPDTTYFDNNIIDVAQGLMVASLVVTLIGIAVAVPGVRCWKENPNWIVAGLGGLLIFLSGVMTIIPIAWYTHLFDDITTATDTTTSVQTEVRVGYCIILGYIGGIFEILGGFVMFIGICRCCGGKNRGEKPLDEVVTGAHFRHQKQPRRVELPPSLSRPRSSGTSSSSSNSSSVPYSRDEDVSFPRAKKSTGAPSANSSSGRPYEADL